jgi:hypothetical protein
MLKKPIFVFILYFFSYSYALADIYCPQYIYCVKDVCKPNQNDQDFSYFHQDTAHSVTNGKYRLSSCEFLPKGNPNVECYYQQNEEHTVLLYASQPLYPDFTDTNNAWTATTNDYNGTYTCSGESNNCPFQLNPDKFLKRQ